MHDGDDSVVGATEGVQEGRAEHVVEVHLSGLEGQKEVNLIVTENKILSYNCENDEERKVVNGETSVAEDVPGPVRKGFDGVLSDSRLRVFQAQQVDGVDEHESVLDPVEERLHWDPSGLGFGEEESQNWAVQVVHLNSEDGRRELPRPSRQNVDLWRGGILNDSLILITKFPGKENKSS